MSKKLYFLIFIGLIAILSACKKDHLTENQLQPANETQPSSLIGNRTDSIPSLSLIAPPFNYVQIIGEAIRNHWSEEDYLGMIHAHGNIAWDKAHLEFESAINNTYVISLPMVKDEVISGILFYIHIDGEQHFTFESAEEMHRPVEDLINDYELWHLILMASSFSDHQYFHNGQIGSYQQKLQEIDSSQIITPRCIQEICDWIYFGDDITYGYIDCYWILQAIDCWHIDPINWSDIPPLEVGNTGVVDIGIGTDSESEIEENLNNLTNINWQPSEDCEFNIAPHLDAQLSNMQLLFPCENLTADQIMNAIMNNLCSQAGEFEYISMDDVEAELANYEYIDMNLLVTDPEQFGEQYIEAVCSCPEISEADCVDDAVAPPASCESFDFTPVGGLNLKSRVTGNKLAFASSNGSWAICPINVQLTTSSFIQVIATGELLPVPPGLAANAAAAALNESTRNTVFHFGNQGGIFHNSNCPTYIEYFEDEEFQDNFEARLLDMLSNHYWLDVWEWDFAFDNEPTAQVGYTGEYVPETIRVPDWSMIIGLYPDNCIDSNEPQSGF